MPSELIKLMGDWQSSAYLRYLEPSSNTRLKVSTMMIQEAFASSVD